MISFLTLSWSCCFPSLKIDLTSYFKLLRLHCDIPHDEIVSADATKTEGRLRTEFDVVAFILPTAWPVMATHGDDEWMCFTDISVDFILPTSKMAKEYDERITPVPFSSNHKSSKSFIFFLKMGFEREKIKFLNKMVLISVQSGLLLQQYTSTNTSYKILCGVCII